MVLGGLLRLRCCDAVHARVARVSRWVVPLEAMGRSTGHRLLAATAGLRRVLSRLARRVRRLAVVDLGSVPIRCTRNRNGFGARGRSGHHWNDRWQ